MQFHRLNEPTENTYSKSAFIRVNYQGVVIRLVWYSAIYHQTDWWLSVAYLAPAVLPKPLVRSFHWFLHTNFEIRLKNTVVCIREMSFRTSPARCRQQLYLTDIIWSTIILGAETVCIVINNSSAAGWSTVITIITVLPQGPMVVHQNEMSDEVKLRKCFSIAGP